MRNVNLNNCHTEKGSTVGLIWTSCDLEHSSSSPDRSEGAIVAEAEFGGTTVRASILTKTRLGRPSSSV